MRGTNGWQQPLDPVERTNTPNITIDPVDPTMRRILPFLLLSTSFATRHCTEPLRWVDRCETPQVKTGICHRETCEAGTGESDVCTLVTHALLAELSVFDVVFLTSGHCQDEIFPGAFTFEDAARALPYNEELIALHLNGSNLLSAIEHGLDQFHRNGLEAAYPRLAGIRFVVSPNWPFGRRISRPEILNRGCHWHPVIPDKIYSILTTQSLAEGGYHYHALTRVVSRDGTGLHLTDMFYEHAQTTCILRDPFARPKQQPARRNTIKVESSLALPNVTTRRTR